MYNKDNKNKKIPYPPIVEGYISTRILKEKITEFLITKNNQSEANADSSARSTIMRMKKFLLSLNDSKAILRVGERGKEQFLIEALELWQNNKHKEFKEFILTKSS
ncbi:hypothetical protein [Candidatus Methylopumilus universalis]|jgi:hypothetical protein|uniref:hypothetical protein n=1 Tax=Candidatus Methylopumilus universalis TaxID=2588536 RepID=UPI001121FB52|nr:hypothetical protein [Candidatus Methylopumilus universalis]QDC71728.1 hypothetical protein FIT75_02520 [Candidatus Methylopumilus universalis]